VVVFRTFPIRVAGQQAGTLKGGEVTWDQIQRESGYPYPVYELTTVTRKTRRVGNFDWQLAADAIRINRPTRLAVNGLDYLQYSDRTVTTPDALSTRSRRFLEQLSRHGVPIGLLGVGPRLTDFLPFSMTLDALTGCTEQPVEMITG
jgi:adenylosuccinate synthase